MDVSTGFIYFPHEGTILYVPWPGRRHFLCFNTSLWHLRNGQCFAHLRTFFLRTDIFFQSKLPRVVRVVVRAETGNGASLRNEQLDLKVPSSIELSVASNFCPYQNKQSEIWQLDTQTLMRYGTDITISHSSWWQLLDPCFTGIWNIKPIFEQCSFSSFHERHSA